MIRIEISLEGAAFDDYPENEVGRILRKLSDGFLNGDLVVTGTGMLRDVNGNAAGQWEYILPKGPQDV